MKPFHVAQNCLILPILDELESRGVNINVLIKKSGLWKFDLKNQDMYIPLGLYYIFLKEVKDLGIDDFFNQFYNAQKTRNLSTYGEHIHLMPNLLEACKFAEIYNQLLLSNEIIKIEINGTQTICKVDLIGEKHIIWDEIELLTLAQIIHTTRLAAGEDWAPQEIHLRTKIMPDFNSIFISSNHPPNIKLGQACTQLVFKTEILADQICINPEKTTFAKMNPHSNVEKITSIIESSQTIPTITEISDYFDTSISSFKRSLAYESQTYQNLVDNWRLKKAIKLVLNPDLQIKEIAHELRFSNSANFSRAFKRWTNLYPETYRDQL